MNLPDHWYVICETSELNSKRPNSLRRHGREWVVWRRSDGNWIMQQDRCPHRSARLSQGTIKKDCVVCPFHGFQFSHEGKCELVPETGREAPNLKIESHVLKEAHGFLWWKKGNVESTEPPWFEELPGGSWGSHDSHQWNQHVSRCIENQLDYVHLPFVHAKTIGKYSDPKRKAKFLFSQEGIRMLTEYQEQDGAFTEKTGIRFLYPGLWRLKILPQLNAFIAFVAVDEDTTRMYLRTYQSFVMIPGVRRVLGWIVRRMNRRVLREDLSVVLGQTPKDVRQLDDSNRESLFASDEGIRQFRKWLSQSL